MAPVPSFAFQTLFSCSFDWGPRWFCGSWVGTDQNVVSLQASEHDQVGPLWNSLTDHEEQYRLVGAAFGTPSVRLQKTFELILPGQLLPALHPTRHQPGHSSAGRQRLLQLSSSAPAALQRSELTVRPRTMQNIRFSSGVYSISLPTTQIYCFSSFKHSKGYSEIR